MKQFISSRYWLVYLGLIINISFFLSAFLPYHWYDFFFFGSSLHYCCQGMDFYQIPNGAYAFAKGGTLWGQLPVGVKPYAFGFYSNYNVYHPLFTILLGSFLILISPASAFYIWMGIKLIVNILVVYFLFRHYHSKRFFPYAVFIYLIYFSQYSEIRISQYQFVFNLLLLFFLHTINQFPKNKLLAGIYFFGTILVKPISLLWIPAFFIKRQFKTVIIGSILFLAATLPFLYFHSGYYYLFNLLHHILFPAHPGTIDIMSLVALLHVWFDIPYITLSFVKWIVLGIILLLTFSKRISIVTIIYLLAVYFLFFYDLIYQYHYSILSSILVIGILTTPAFQTKTARVLAFILAMPTIFFLLRLTNIGYHFNPIDGPDPTRLGWELVSLVQIIPISILSIILVQKDVQIECKELWKKLRNKFIADDNKK